MIPQLTDEQRRANLVQARYIRRKRAIIREALKDGSWTVAKVLAMADKGDEAASGMRVKQLISACPGYGFARTRDLMHKLHISENRRVRGLGARQREALLDEFERIDIVREVFALGA